MRALLAVLLLLTLAFAGCASKDGGGDDDPSETGTGTGSSTTTGTGTSTGTASSSGSGTGSPTDNRAPTATLAANVTTGAAPLAVNFTINGTDADEDSLRWSLAFADGTLDASGSAVPAFELHSFTVAGTYLILLNLTDGNATAQANVTVTVTAPSPSGGAPFSVDLATNLPCTDCYFSPAATGQCAEFLSGEPKGLRCDWAELPADLAGRDFLLVGGTDPGLEFYTTCDGASAESKGAQDETAATEEGTVPAGALCIVVYEFESPFAEFTFSVA